MTDLMQKFLEAEDANAHTEATMIVAREIEGATGPAYLTILQEIAGRHELMGHILPNDRTLRDAIQADVLNTARVQGLI